MATHTPVTDDYSRGQVHLAKVGGQQVVVKVQRPGLRELFEVDLKNIRKLAQWLQTVDPKSDGAARDWVAIYDECATILYQVHSDGLLRNVLQSCYHPLSVCLTALGHCRAVAGIQFISLPPCAAIIVGPGIACERRGNAAC